jgi:hypothetical protein
LSVDESPVGFEVFDDEAESVDVVADVVVSVPVVADSSEVESVDAESVEDEPVEDDDSVSSAHARPGMLTVNPAPTPRATASAPTRPTNREYPWAPTRAVRC